MNYELFILGELIDQPMHGYLLREIIEMAIGPFRRMSWGALYPLLRRLEADGLIEQVPDTEASGDRPRKIYGITEAGRERFLYLLLRPAEQEADYIDAFNMRMVNFDHLTPLQQREIVAAYRSYLQFALAHLTKARQFVVAETHIAAAEKTWILRCQDHRIHLVAADLEWINALEADLSKE